MADSKPKSGSPPAPSFYSAAASMQGKPPDAGGGAGTPGGQQGEKAKNVQVLLEVFDKMDKLEEDASKKKLIQSMADIAKEYMQMLEGKGAKTTSQPATGEAGSGGMGAGPGAGGAGAGAGAGVGAPEMAGAA